MMIWILGNIAFQTRFYISGKNREGKSTAKVPRKSRADQLETVVDRFPSFNAPTTTTPLPQRLPVPMSNPTADWERVADKYYRKVKLYDAIFDQDLELENYIVAGAPYGGALGMTTFLSKVTY